MFIDKSKGLIEYTVKKSHLSTNFILGVNALWMGQNIAIINDESNFMNNTAPIFIPLLLN